MAGDEGHVVCAAVRHRDRQHGQIRSELNGFEGDKGVPEVFEETQLLSGTGVGVHLKPPATLCDERTATVVAMVVRHQNRVQVFRMQIKQLSRRSSEAPLNP